MKPVSKTVRAKRYFRTLIRKAQNKIHVGAEERSLARTGKVKPILGEIASYVERTELGRLPTQIHTAHINGENTKFAHSRTYLSQDESSKYSIQIVDEISTHSGNYGRFQILWKIDSGVEVVLHGQGFELFRDGTKWLDAQFEANISTTTSIHDEPYTHGIKDRRRVERSDKDRNRVVSVAFEAAQIRMITIFRSELFTYRDRGLLSNPDQWRRYSSSVSLNYLFQPCKDAGGCKFLVVAFSAMSQIGDFNFNYKATLDPIDVNVLYILDDFGNQGSYYLMDHENKAIFDSVQRLISKITTELGINRENILTIGSSKGGTAAIIHGVAADVGHVYVGAPQTKIGSFLSHPHPNVLEFMMGSTEAASIDKIDNYLYDMVERTDNWPDVHIVVGDADHHYKGHVLPFVEHAVSNDRTISVELLSGIPHSQIGVEYKKRLAKYIQLIISRSDPVEPLSRR